MSAVLLLAVLVAVALGARAAARAGDTHPPLKAATARPSLSVYGRECTFEDQLGTRVAVAAGRVRNSSGHTLRGVSVSASWDSSDGVRIGGANGRLDTEPLLEGQDATYRVGMVATNPDMKTCRVSFSDSSGRPLPASFD